MRTAWGYEVATGIEPLITVNEFHEITGGAFVGNCRVEQALAATSQVIRNYCCWHIAPSLECNAFPSGGGPILKLPAGYVSTINSVKEHGEEVTDYEARSDGLLKRKGHKKWSKEWDSIEVSYVAGYDIIACPDLAEAVASITAGVLSVSAGVASESADGVSISYSASASSIASSMTQAMKHALDAYKVVSSHAA